MAYDFVILAAGRGKRLRPITENYPKSMVRVLGKPLLEWMVDGILSAFGREAGKIILVVGFEKEKAEAYFKAKEYSDKIVFVEQKEQLGTAHAILQAKASIHSDKFFVLNSDSFFEPSLYGKLASEAWSEGPKQFVVAKRIEDASQFGVLKTENGKLTGLVEKPLNAVNELVSTGTFFLPKSFFGYLEKVEKSQRGEYEVTDAILSFAKADGLHVTEFSGYWSDVGYYWQYLEASEYAMENLMTEKKEGSIEAFVTIKGKLHLGKNSVVKSGTYIEGNAYVGDNCVVGPSAYLRKGAVIEDNCHVGNSTEVKNSIIMKGSNAAHFSYIGDSIICENVNFGAGTIIANLKFDNSEVKVVSFDGEKTTSSRRKLGAVVGSDTKTGINVSINCGVLIGERCRIYPGAIVKENLGNDAELKV